MHWRPQLCLCARLRIPPSPSFLPCVARYFVFHIHRTVETTTSPTRRRPRSISRGGARDGGEREGARHARKGRICVCIGFKRTTSTINCFVCLFRFYFLPWRISKGKKQTHAQNQTRNLHWQIKTRATLKHTGKRTHAHSEGNEKQK